jgi:hypothetical protein
MLTSGKLKGVACNELHAPSSHHNNTEVMKMRQRQTINLDQEALALLERARKQLSNGLVTPSATATLSAAAKVGLASILAKAPNKPTRAA